MNIVFDPKEVRNTKILQKQLHKRSCFSHERFHKIHFQIILSFHSFGIKSVIVELVTFEYSGPFQTDELQKCSFVW
jgi:hypothetical protein